MNAINKNPFAGLRTIVKGIDFIGREQYINELYEQILTKSFCSVAIVGIPHVGKSSLMYKLYERRKELWNEHRIIVVWQTIQNVPGLRRDLFLTMANSAYLEVKRLCKNEEFLLDLQESLEILKEENIRWNEFKQCIYAFFSTLIENGIHVVSCFDEFDYVKGNLTEGEYQLLRDLIDFPSYKIAIVTTSRRSIFDIERDSGGGSNLFSLLYNIHVQPFSITEHELQCKRILGISSSEIEELWTLTGGHPFVNSLILEKYWSCKSINKARDLANAEISQYFRNLFKVLKKDGLDGTIDRLYCGYLDGVTEAQKEYITIKYGLFNTHAESYSPFSTLFLDFLKERYKNIPFSIVWPDTERNLKKIITSAIVKHFNCNDHNILMHHIQQLDKIPNERFSLWRSQMYSEIHKYKETGSRNVIMQIYPKDIKIFFDIFWEEFLSNIFHQNLTYWLDRINFLADDVRNPMMHSRKGLLLDKDVLKAVLICQEINERINIFYTKKNK